MASNVSLLDGVKDVLFGGIRPDIPGHGGEECANFLTVKSLTLETMLSLSVMGILGIFAALTYTMPKHYPRSDDFRSKHMMLVFASLLFGIEIGYKLCSKQVLYLLNPCHVITMVEIYLLAAKPGKFSFCVFRILMHQVYGPMLALIWPDTQCRLLPGETLVYWVQHGFIFFVVPPYLIYIWGPECVEPFSEWAWACFTGITFGIHNYFILQPLALITYVNLNFILCPGNVIPGGYYYRAFAIFHQALSILTIGKVYTLIIKRMLKFFPEYKPNYYKVE